MNFVFPAMIIAALICGIFTGNADAVINAGFEGAEAAVKTVLSIAGIVCMWSGILKIAERGGVMNFFASALSPVIRLLFPSLDKKSSAFKYISMNMTANLLGVGNAATPMGIKAIKELDTLNNHTPSPSRDMCRFILINTASLQLIPSTVIALRAAHGSSAPSNIVIPVWIVSAVALAIGICTLSILSRLSGKKANKL